MGFRELWSCSGAGRGEAQLLGTGCWGPRRGAAGKRGAGSGWRGTFFVVWPYKTAISTDGKELAVI